MMSLYTLLALPLMLAVLGSAVLSLVFCLQDLLRRRHSLPSLHFRESTLNSRLLARCGLRHRVFSPAFWLTSPHVQSVLAACWPRGGDGQEVTFQREYLQMRDKGVVALDWVLSVQPRVKRKSTVLLVLPPVTGNAHTVSSLCELATRRGFRTVVFNRRGHGGSVLTTAKLLSAADPSDLRQVIKYLRLRFPKSRLVAVAYGTGCGLLISYLGEFGSSAFLSAGACVSPCYDTVDKFSGSLRSVYDLVHLLKLKWILLQHAKALSSVVDVRHALLKAWSFRAYEEAVYCRMYNYTSRSDSTSRGSHPAVAVNANGVAPSGSTVNTSSSPPVSVGQNGAQPCGNVSSSGGVSHSAGVLNGNVVVEASEAVTTVSQLPRSSLSASKTCPPSSVSASQSVGRSASRSTSLSTSSSLSQPVSQSETEKLQPSLSASQTVSVVQTSSSMKSTSQPTPTSDSSSKSTTMSRLPPASASPSGPPSSSKESSASHSKSSPLSQNSTVRASQLISSPASSSMSPSVMTSKPTSASPLSTLPVSQSTSASASSLTSSPPALSSPPTSHSPPPSPLPPPPHSPSSASNNQEEYWERNNPIRDVDDIAVPVLCINSLDDPFFVSTSGASTSTIPYDLFRCYPNFLLVVTEKGGHCGFLERYPFKSWADSLCLDYLEAVFELTTRGHPSAASASTSAVSSSNSRRNTRSTI